MLRKYNTLIAVEDRVRFSWWNIAIIWPSSSFLKCCRLVYFHAPSITFCINRCWSLLLSVIYCYERKVLRSLSSTWNHCTICCLISGICVLEYCVYGLAECIRSLYRALWLTSSCFENLRIRFTLIRMTGRRRNVCSIKYHFELARRRGKLAVQTLGTCKHHFYFYFFTCTTDRRIKNRVGLCGRYFIHTFVST